MSLIEGQRSGTGGGRVSVIGGATPDQVDDLRRRFVGKRNDAEFCSAPAGHLVLVDVKPWISPAPEGGSAVQYIFGIGESAPGSADRCDFNELP